jgi:hypothetical protein
MAYNQQNNQQQKDQPDVRAQYPNLAKDGNARNTAPEQNAGADKKPWNKDEQNKTRKEGKEDCAQDKNDPNMKGCG